MATSETIGIQLRHGLSALAATAAATAAVTGAAPAASAPSPEIRAYKPVADSYVSSLRPHTNFGRSTILRVGGAPETTAYLRFELKKMSGNVTSVTLLLRPRSHARARFAVRRVTARGWTERRLTFANAPVPSARYTAARPVRVGAWNAIDVTSFVEGGGEVSLAITTRASKKLSFASRESRHPPRLVVRSGEKDVDGLVLEALLDD